MGKVVPAGWGWVVVPLLSPGHLTPDSPGIWQGLALGATVGCVVCGSCTGLARVAFCGMVTILRGGRCRWVRRAFFRWWEVPLRQGVPAPSAPACHLGQAGPPHTLQCPLQPRTVTAHQVLGRGGGSKASSQVSRCSGPPTGGPCPRPPTLLKQGCFIEGHPPSVELVDKKRWVSVS